MTREEAIEYNKNLRMYMKISDKNQPCKFLEENYIALDMAIKALEQESKTDRIEYGTDGNAYRLSISNGKEYEQEQNTGHWIEEIDDYGKVMRWHCDKCYEDSGFTTECKWNYCPNCGAKMQAKSNIKQGLNYADADTLMPAT